MGLAGKPGPPAMITLGMAFFQNGGMLRVHQDTWSSYSPKLKSRFQVVVVDDCSPDNTADESYKEVDIVSYRLYRLTRKVRWNWLACRNLAAKVADTSWLILTDMDHLLPEETLSFLLNFRIRSDRVYRFNRVSAPDLTPYHPHADSFFLPKELFWKIGGYDERFSGLYGSSSDIRHRMRSLGIPIELLPVKLVRYPREVVPDASTPKTVAGKPTRKTPEDEAGLKRVRSQISLLPVKDRRPVVLSFPYERLR